MGKILTLKLDIQKRNINQTNRQTELKQISYQQGQECSKRARRTQ